MGRYLDAILDSDFNPVFSGTPDETQTWLATAIEQGTHSEEWRVCIGASLAVVTIDEYQRRKQEC